MKDLFGVIIRPLVTEKSATLQELDNVYTFAVSLEANKVEIRKAVESLFGVKVESVRTIVQRGKAKRFGRHQGQRSNWKKAYVKLAADHSIDLLPAV